MKHGPKHYFPDAYQVWLFEALGLNDGEELEPLLLENLFKLNRQWVHTDDVMDYDADNDLMRAYTLYYMTINMPKLWFIMDHASSEIRNIRNVVEFGCGPGTFLWAYLFYLAKAQPDHLHSIETIHGVDRSPVALACARKFSDVLKKQCAFSHINFQFTEGDWSLHLDSDADLAIFGNALNESADDAISLEALKCDQVMIIEPGTRKVFHRLLHIRKDLVEKGYAIQFPCPTSISPCPMQDAGDNWCHFAINRFSLPFIQRISNVAGRLNPRHNFSGFYFGRSEGGTGDDDWRCLSKLKKVKRSGIRWLCNGCELKETILNRHARSETNRPFLDADWGDSLKITPRLSGTRLKGEDQVSESVKDSSY